MRLFLPVRIIRTSQVGPTLSDRLRPALAVLAFLALVELVVRHGYRLQLTVAANIALYAFEWLVVVAYALDVALDIIVARTLLEYLRRNWYDPLVLAVVIIGMFSGVAATLPAIARQAVVTFRILARSGRFGRFVGSLRRHPVQLMALSFIALIALGTLLLTFPAATADGRGDNPLDALFTATSATCVTGLVVHNTQLHYARFGQWVILLLIQLGGLGIMTFSASVVVLLGRRLGAFGRETMAQVVEDSRDLDLAQSLRYILLFTLLAEVAGALVLFLRWLGEYRQPVEALFVAGFHSISAFCNAGFSVFPNSLVRFQSDVVVNLTVIVLVVSGGLGFSVVHEIVNRRSLGQLLRRVLGQPVAQAARLSTHALLVLRTTMLLIGAGAILFFFFEYDGALSGLPLGTKLLASLFQSVTTRTAGFNTVPLDALRPVTLLVVILLMYVGASPGGTGGGVKTSTLAVLFLTFRNLVAGREQVEVANRTIPRETVYRAIAIASGGVAVIVAILAVLLVTESFPFQNILFEVTSAFGTVGLSTGITPLLSPAGKLGIILLMYVGRLGPLTLALAMRTRLSRLPIEFPQARIVIG